MLLDRVDLGGDVVAAFTRAAAGNLSHRRPHVPSRLARRRTRVAGDLRISPGDLHFMQQVHGARVGTVDAETVRGAEIRGVDALVTDQPGRALAVQVADCVPVLLASHHAVGAVHVGRKGLVAGVVEAALDAFADLAPGNGRVRAAIGPAIGGCCYEVPAGMRDEVAAAYPQAAATTTWGTAALDIPAAVAAVLEQGGVQVRATWPGCTRCDPGRRWFSHRRDADAGRQLGVVVRVASDVPDTRQADAP